MAVIILDDQRASNRDKKMMLVFLKAMSVLGCLILLYRNLMRIGLGTLR